MNDLLRKIFEHVKKRDWVAYQDALAYMSVHYDKEDVKAFRRICREQIQERPTEDVIEAYRLSYLVAAPYDLDSYMTYMEIDRKPEERFWLPRREKLKPVCDALQELEDGELDELFTNMPPRVGKTVLMEFFTTHVMGKDTEHPKLYCSYSDTITNSFYNGVMEIITDETTYKFREVFPNAIIVKKNAAEETIDLERLKRYPSLTARSLYGTLNGACDAASGYIISDDLVSGIEEALNKDRLLSVWSKVDNNLLTRGKDGTKLLWIGTRWSVIDPAGIRMDILENDERFKDHRWKVISVPALNENDESNFDYKYGVGFSTTYYHQRRASFERNNDMASWQAQYQNLPVEREGTVFNPDDFRYFTELPEAEPDRVFIAVDPAWGGGDFVAAPICYQYGEDIYVADVIYDNSDKSITQRRVAGKIKSHGVSSGYVEGTKMTAEYGESVQKMVRDLGWKVSLIISTKHFTGRGKETRIFEKAPDIREHFIFLKSGKRSKEYELYMQNVFAFKIIGKNKNDDAPDSLSMACTYALGGLSSRAIIGKRMF